MQNLDDPDITQDYFYKGKVYVCQAKNGYRFSVDAPILADFLPFAPDQEALEVGTGCGIIALLALFREKFSTVHGMEVQHSLARLAEINAGKNNFPGKLQVIQGDFNHRCREFQGIRHIFSNPPYFETLHGRLSPNPQIRDARSETRLTLSQLLTRSFSILGKKGNLYLVLPYARYGQIMEIAEKTGCSMAKMRKVFSFKDGKPGRFLVQLSNYDVSPEIVPPLIIFKKKGVYTDEMDSILTG